MEFTLTVRECCSCTVNDQWGITWQNEIAIHFTASPLRHWDRTYDISDLESIDDLYICSHAKYKILNTRVRLLQPQISLAISRHWTVRPWWNKRIGEYWNSNFALFKSKWELNHVYKLNSRLSWTRKQHGPPQHLKKITNQHDVISQETGSVM